MRGRGYAWCMADLSGLQLGKYSLEERIGRGGMSDVYRASAAELEGSVALKVLPITPDDDENDVFQARFDEEARIIARMRHDHLLPLLDYGRNDDYAYFVMPLITGGTLADRIRADTVEISIAGQWLEQVASALDHAHALNVVHRDLKPTNVLVDENETAFLTDFGIAKVIAYTRELTRTGNVIGTPAYMAPEQWRGESLTARTDVYGLGVMAYLMLTKRTPFEAEAAHTMMYLHLSQHPTSITKLEPSITEAINVVVMKALAKDATLRYESAGAFAADFRRAVDGLPILALSSGITQPTYAQPATPASPSIQGVRPSGSSPPPVYGGSYRTATYPIPTHLRRKRTRLPRWLFWATLLSSIILVVIILGVAGAVFVNSRSNDNATDIPTAAATETPPPASPSATQFNPVDVPRVRVDSPQSVEVVELGEEIAIQVVAFDSQGVTRIELRRFGIAIQTIASDTSSGTSPFAVNFDYVPDTTGQHSLEVVAFRDDIEGESRFITIIVR